MRKIVNAWLGRFVVTCIALTPALATAADYSETVSGDLSANGAAPTQLALTAGANNLSGNAGEDDYDLLTLVVPAGHRLDSLVLTNDQLVDTNSSFIAFQTGAQWTNGFGSGANFDQSLLLGYALFTPSQIGSDLLVDIADSYSRFTAPLVAGAYTLLLQDTGAKFTYGFQFNVSLVPEPATMGLLTIAATTLMHLARSRRNA